MTIEEIAEWNSRYPYFIIPALSALKKHVDTDESERRKMVARLAISVGDREELCDILGDELMSLAEFYPDKQQSSPTTTDAIDSFLETFAPADSRETDLLTKMIFNPNPDYASQLAAEEKKSAPSNDELDNGKMSENDLLINRFIANDREKKDTKAEREFAKEEKAKSDKLTNTEIVIQNPTTESDNSSLTESFAKVMIKNGNYRKALEIITNLSLNNPEKSIYFADQIRFLRKLIINENN